MISLQVSLTAYSVCTRRACLPVLSLRDFLSLTSNNWSLGIASSLLLLKETKTAPYRTMPNRRPAY